MQLLPTTQKKLRLLPNSFYKTNTIQIYMAGKHTAKNKTIELYPTRT